MPFVKALFSGWWNAMGTLLTLAGLIAYVVSDVGHKHLKVPSWLPLLVAFASFGIVSYRIWRKEWLRAEANQGLRDRLKDKCDAIILGWETLGEAYQNAPKEQGQAATLPNPLDPGWISYGFKVWPYQVGILQGKTNALREDLEQLGIQVGEWDYAHMTLAELLHALRNYRIN